MVQASTPLKSVDRRKLNNPHEAVQVTGAEVPYKGYYMHFSPILQRGNPTPIGLSTNS